MQSRPWMKPPAAAIALPSAEDAPLLVVVVDTEEEFDWNSPFNRQSRAVVSASCQDRAHEIYEGFGLRPTYVMDYPIVSTDSSAAYFADLRKAGQCELGAHLHPWVTPPDEEEVTRWNSYQGNLPRDLEAAKISTMTAAMRDRFDFQPRIFKAGRCGLGPNTLDLIHAAGYRIDCSVVPHTDFSSDGGPVFTDAPTRPYWLNDAKDLLEVPLTKGFSGMLGGFGHHCAGLFDSPALLRARVPGVLSRLGLLERATLSPEGHTAEEQMVLLSALYQRGHRVFYLTYHSPSLDVGNTPYVRDRADLERLLDNIRQVLTYFRDQMGGRFTTLDELYDLARETTIGAGAAA